MLWLRGVPAHQAVLPECPDVPDSRDWILRRLRDVVHPGVLVKARILKRHQVATLHLSLPAQILHLGRHVFPGGLASV